MREETPTSKLIGNFLNECFNKKSLLSKLSEYSAKHSQSGDLSIERKRHLNRTEELIQQIGNSDSIYQIRTLIRHQPLEIQYFILERASVLRVATTIDNRLCLHLDREVPQQIFEMLQQLWEEHLYHISKDGVDLDTHISHIVHGYI